MATGDDRPMNNFATVQDAAYVYGEDTNGNQVKIRKSDLVNIISELINPIRASANTISVNDWSFRSAMVNGIYSVMDPPLSMAENPGITYGVLIVARSKEHYVTQIAINIDGKMYSRFCNPSQGTYGGWSQ